jgi:hypothetical protein
LHWSRTATNALLVRRRTRCSRVAAASSRSQSRPIGGWLGPYLLDAMLDAASARAVPKLEADVLADNQIMLTLARSRGGVIVRRPHSGVVRVSVPTSEPVRRLDRMTVRRPADRRAGILTGGAAPSARGLGALRRRRNDHHGTRGVLGDPLADRAEQQPGEPASPP